MQPLLGSAQPCWSATTACGRRVRPRLHQAGTRHLKRGRRTGDCGALFVRHDAVSNQAKPPGKQPEQALLVRSTYLACIDRYATSGIDLAGVPLAGLGSVGRRQATGEIAAIAAELAAAGLRLHGFGVKQHGLARYADHLASADSLAWSYHARRRPPLAGCTQHRNCANCPRYALAWREGIARELDGPRQLRLAPLDQVEVCSAADAAAQTGTPAGSDRAGARNGGSS